jgi:DNA (cytosine-5)-methyltransferase 1
MSKQYKWNLSDGYPEKNGYKVFSCFACGGGSTMGYKRAGFDVIGMNEIDPKMADAYIANHKPKYSFIEPIQSFKLRDDLPEELFSLDILDGSPPCSSFSISGNREKDWGKEKKFKEGQAEQVLDTLFFDFIDLAKRLQPKVVIAENVKGMLMGAAKDYVIEIHKQMDEAGYYTQHWLFNAADMGLPQKRQRVFFIGLRKDLADPFLYQKDMFTQVPKIDLVFNERHVNFSEVFQDYEDRPLSEHFIEYWNIRKKGDIDFRYSSERLGRNPNANFNHKYIYMNKVANTITGGDLCVLFDFPRYRNKQELCECSSFPLDYDFRKNRPEYIMGMSVPPLMIQKIVEQIKIQWLDKL